jgi:hypothetical protein
LGYGITDAVPATRTVNTKALSADIILTALDVGALASDHEASAVTTVKITNWDTAYGWGDHAGLYDASGTAAGAVSTHEADHPAPTNRDTRNDPAGSAATVQGNLDTHIGTTTGNPHSVTKSDIGLANVTNDAQLKIASNLSDLNNAATARTNLGLSDAATTTVAVIRSGTTAANVGLDNVPNEDATDMANWDQKSATPGQVPAWNGSAWVPVTIETGSSNGISLILEYADRAQLRSADATEHDSAIVRGLGLFIFTTNSDEPDDDESCFATTTGKWILEAVHWDLVYAWQLPDNEWRDTVLTKFLFGTANCNIASVASQHGASFTATIAGAVPGDAVITSPPSFLCVAPGEVNAGSLSYYAWVSAIDTVTIMIINSSTATRTVNSGAQDTWSIMVVKHT